MYRQLLAASNQLQLIQTRAAAPVLATKAARNLVRLIMRCMKLRIGYYPLLIGIVDGCIGAS